MINVGQKYSFGVTFDRDDLFVAAKVYDNSGSSPALLATVEMLNYYGNSYQGSYTPVVPMPLLIQKSVYTDGTFTTLDTDYSQGDETEEAVTISGGGGGSSNASCSLIGFILNNDTLIGFIEC